MNALDIVFIVILLIFAMGGFKRGFLQELFKLLKWLFSYVGAKLLTSSVSLYLYEFFKIETHLNNKVTEMVGSLDFSSLDNLRTTIEVGLSEIPLLGGYVSKVLEQNWNLTELYQSGVADIQSKLVTLIMNEITPTAMSFMESVTFILLFLLLIIILGIIFNAIIKITHNSKLLGGADKLLGGVLGAIKGVIIFILVFAILYLIASLTSSEYLSTLQASRFFDIVNGMFNIIPK